MGQVVITGASGFIGREVVARFLATGHVVVPLCRIPRGGMARRWSLGELLPQECQSADLIVHLASATLNQQGSKRVAAVQSDIDGTRMIIEQLRRWRLDGARHRLVFVSSQSATSESMNDYGRSKWRIEQMLDQPDEIILRPGLVYSEPPQSVYAMFDKLSRLPVVPVVATRPCIQPVSVQELADYIVHLGSRDDPPKTVMVGAARPLTFAQALKAAARRSGRRSPITVPFPLGPLKATAGMVDRLVGSTMSERLNGIVGLHAFDAAASAAALGLPVKPF